MLQEAIDFRDESHALYNLVAPLSDADFDRPTGFKNWTINDILAHLHYFNWLADLTLRDEPQFEQAYGEFNKLRKQEGATMLSATDQSLDGIKGIQLLNTWHDYLQEMANNWVEANPKQRLKWVGPTMSVRSSMTARLMETWSHAQAIYDLLGVEREEHDRIRGVAVIGVNTFGWTFVNRQLDVPQEPPFLRLTAPSGEIWTWHAESDTNRIEGQAVDFCRIVTQTRNVADTGLKILGDTATRWMSMAQCFAGPPQDPPAAGTRKRASAPYSI